MSDTQEKQDVAQILDDAADKLHAYRYPHVVKEEEWVGEWAHDIKSIRYRSHPYYDVKKIMLGLRKDWRHPFRRSTVFPLYDDLGLPGWLEGFADNLGMSLHRLWSVDSYAPDATLHGNPIIWMEHAAYLALWSPGVSESLIPVLRVTAQAVRDGDDPVNKTELVEFAQRILEKDVWKETPDKKLPLSIRERVGHGVSKGTYYTFKGIGKAYQSGVRLGEWVRRKRG